jgi:flagellar hook-associated protein 2
MASPITFGGISSGIDTKAIVDALINAESIPLNRVRAVTTLRTAQRDGYTRIRSAANDLLAALRPMAAVGGGPMSARSATPVNDTTLTASATSSAVAASYSVAVTRLATPTVARSTAAVGTAITADDIGQFMGDLPMAGTPTAGVVRIDVNGTLVSATIGSPTTTTIDDALMAIADAISGAMVAGGDPSAAVGVTITNNQAVFSVSGATGSHTIRFGATADTSNFIELIGLRGTSANGVTDGSTITGTRAIGAVPTGGTIDAAGLTGLTSTAAGVLTINGVAIAYDTTDDSLADVIGRINASGAGVIASLDRINDKVLLTASSAGPLPMAIEDTAGTLGAALNLAPGTTTAQTLGLSAQVTIDGVLREALSNTPSDLIDGVTLNLKAAGAATTLTVAPDNAGIATALGSVVAKYNAIVDAVDAVSSAKDAVLRADPNIRRLIGSVREVLMARGATSGQVGGLGDMGVSSGAVGTAPGATRRLTLDATKMAAAIAADPEGVRTIVGGASGRIAAAVDSLELIAGSSGTLYAAITRSNDELSALRARQSTLTDRLAARRLSLERTYAKLESILGQLSSQSAQLNASNNNS